ncbi:hypothetical protein ABAC460_03560 [Asticcacaulis sp. AC460]|nr:hypothetical protein ABAC460_03560 [Asticcacaulis sp. AC460]
MSLATYIKAKLFDQPLTAPRRTRGNAPLKEHQALARVTAILGHPRMIIFHEKEGRRPAHVVWSRVDADTMTAKNLLHFKRTLREISKQMYLENGWHMRRVIRRA